MAKTVSATEAKTHFGAMMHWASTHGECVIIESRGRPRAVLMDFEEYQGLQEAKEVARRREALKRLEALAERVSGRNQDLDEEGASELADRFVRETVEDMGKHDGSR